MAASSTAVRRRAPARSSFWSRLGLLALLALAIVLVLPLFFAGSRDRLAEGTRIAGIDVGGLTAKDAKALLKGRASRLERVPVSFASGSRTVKLTARELGVGADWSSAGDAAMRQGGGVGIVRGYRRLSLQFFPQDLVPPTRAYEPALDYELGLMAKAVDAPHKEAQLVRRGLHITIAAGVTGRRLDRTAAAERIVHALASFSRAPVSLPVRIDRPGVTVASLTAAQRRASTIVSAPVRMVVDTSTLRVPRWRLAKILDLDTLRFRGPAADAFFRRLAKQVARPPRDATFAIRGTAISVVPAKPGLALDVPGSASALLAAASRRVDRTADLKLAIQQPGRSTKEAQMMGITGIVGSYETFYGGDSDRVHNVQLVAHLVDDKLIAPGATFSFNGTTGERSAEKGFLEAPVIINGELQTGLGGGVCQVSTTVFNAAYEAGLPITARTNHALYISHYPLGRDATVTYPDTALKFVNDTGHWLLLRTYVGSYSLEVDLYGTPQHRRVDTEAAPLVVTGPPPVKKTSDPSLTKGETIVDDGGAPSQSTHVRRLVYAPSGKLMYDTTWYSSYVAEPELVRVGTKPKPKPAETDTTGTTTTGTTTTGTSTTSTTTTGTTTAPTTTTPRP